MSCAGLNVAAILCDSAANGSLTSEASNDQKKKEGEHVLHKQATEKVYSR